MLVANKRSDDETIDTPTLTKRFDQRLWRRLRRPSIEREQRHIRASRISNAEFYSAARSVYHGISPDVLQDADVINLHWVAGFLDWPSFFEMIPPGKPLVWTLHDIAPFAGGCHYSGACEGFVNNCGACPQLASTREDDLSRDTFKIRSQAYARLHPESMVIAAPSRWIAAEAARSALFGKFCVQHISYGLDLKVFQPSGRQARTAFGLSDSDRVILFVCDDFSNHRKGMDLLLAAIEGMERRDDRVLISVGNGTLPTIDGIRVLHFGRIESEELLSVVYGLADVFVIPSREDNLPQTAVEAIACGCPVAGFAIGGIPDIVEHGHNGYLAKPFDIRELRACIETTIERRNELSPAARLRAERLFGLETQARAYQNLYEGLVRNPAQYREQIALGVGGRQEFRDERRTGALPVSR